MKNRFELLAVSGLIGCPLAAQTKNDTIKEQKIEEVVVTALGIKRQDKSLGYVAEKVDAKTFEETQNNNWLQSIEGKVAGLKVQTAGAGPLGSARMKLSIKIYHSVSPSTDSWAEWLTHKPTTKCRNRANWDIRSMAARIPMVPSIPQ